MLRLEKSNAKEERIREKKKPCKKANKGEFDIQLNLVERYYETEKFRILLAAAKVRFTQNESLIQRIQEWIVCATANAYCFETF